MLSQPYNDALNRGEAHLFLLPDFLLEGPFSLCPLQIRNPLILEEGMSTPHRTEQVYEA